MALDISDPSKLYDSARQNGELTVRASGKEGMFQTEHRLEKMDEDVRTIILATYSYIYDTQQEVRHVEVSQNGAPLLESTQV